MNKNPFYRTSGGISAEVTSKQSPGLPTMFATSLPPRIGHPTGASDGSYDPAHAGPGFGLLVAGLGARGPVVGTFEAPGELGGQQA